MDLTNQDNWNIVRRENLQAERINDSTYKPLRDLSVVMSSPVVMIGLSSKNAKPRWYKGAYASQRLPILPGSTTEFVAAVESANHLCRINALTLLQFPYFGINQYFLILSFPYYFEEMYVEVWQYALAVDGTYQHELDNKLHWEYSGPDFDTDAETLKRGLNNG